MDLAKCAGDFSTYYLTYLLLMLIIWKNPVRISVTAQPSFHAPVHHRQMRPIQTHRPEPHYLASLFF
ncbi:hypothetical protein TWF569_000685 [Orbilia oligospora]|uniref:Uncharacterized protein n=1 Tax=Orbilia oligospora TaxID=2813651 RepID=A0A7C8J0T7_ORBOL|nr:hypothetical protein TWF706_004553 [Orbilia oligospora]KAF3078408.1 hypothetical protein TWF102_003549 [Orbilia oligospora]KAF3082783.1 hypothetical protein TWF103_003094 [Orbilia oligospora]KAF3121543.1 hypothetical protein TWF594_003176 [Orbilia oligospora]KAF3125946.1 hypothetical protein TWF569_000685 [Orbilia oligospora]